MVELPEIREEHGDACALWQEQQCSFEVRALDARPRQLCRLDGGELVEPAFEHDESIVGRLGAAEIDVDVPSDAEDPRTDLVSSSTSADPRSASARRRVASPSLRIDLI